MSDLRDIHRAILLDPYDDLARLAYADALEESGDATRAKRVRDSMAAPHVGNIVGVPEWRDGTWGDVYHCVERRGFVDEWRCTLGDFMDHAGPVFAAHPITEVRLTDRVPRLVFVATGGNASVRVPRGVASAPGDVAARMSLENWHEWCGAADDHLGANRHALPYWFFVSERESRIAFPQAADAYAWASRAAVNYGRHRVGLPTLGVRARA